MSESKGELTEEEKNIFAAIDEGNTVLLKASLAAHPDVNILNDNLMTPLQHAAYKGNKEMVQMLLDQGADPNLCKHQHSYTALHFGGLSGNADVCLALLMAGAKTNVLNTVNRSAAQMAAFVGHHNCVAIINNYVPKSDIDRYTVPIGTQTEPQLPPFIADTFHKLLLQTNLHPVKIALNVQNFVGISEHLREVKSVLESMSEREMKRGTESNEVMSFKLHYLSYIIGEIMKIRQRNQSEEKSVDVTELFTRKLLKPGKEGALDFLDDVLKECIREFPHRECTLFRQMVSTLTSKDPPSALSVVTAAINGQRGFVDDTAVCQSCGEERPAKKCSKCKVVQYCDRNCQRLHWHWHKKVCAKMALQAHDDVARATAAPDVDELGAEIGQLLVDN